MLNIFSICKCNILYYAIFYWIRNKISIYELSSKKMILKSIIAFLLFLWPRIISEILSIDFHSMDGLHTFFSIDLCENSILKLLLLCDTFEQSERAKIILESRSWYMNSNVERFYLWICSFNINYWRIGATLIHVFNAWYRAAVFFKGWMVIHCNLHEFFGHTDVINLNGIDADALQKHAQGSTFSSSFLGGINNQECWLYCSTNWVCEKNRQYH